jgi:hypothetical protein
MLGLKSRGLVSPKHKGGTNEMEVCMKVREHTWKEYMRAITLLGCVINEHLRVYL